MLAQRAVDGKSNEIKAIPELLDMLSLKGAIVTIDAMGTQKEIAQRIVDRGADYVLALKGNQPSLHEDAALFFANPACAESWLAKRHPGSKGLRSLAPSPTVASIKRPAAKASRPASTSPPSNPRRSARIGASKTICIGRWTDFRRRPLPNQKRRFAVEFRHHPPHRLQHS